MKNLRTLLALLSMTSLVFIMGCNSEDENNPVNSPANKFVGRWKSENPILVKIKTDYCTNTLVDVATMEWMVNWVVTETDNPNIVDIVMTYSSSNFTITNPECAFGAGYVPEPQPLHIIGYLTDNSISIEYDNQEIASMDYVNEEITGELSYSYCMVYCQEIYTDKNEFSVKSY